MTEPDQPVPVAPTPLRRPVAVGNQPSVASPPVVSPRPPQSPAAQTATPTGETRSRSYANLQRGFVALFLGLALIPALGLFWAPTLSTTENRVLADFPAVTVGGRANIEYLPELGAWFEDHFAYRNELVAANAHLRAGVFQVSATDQVIVGQDGWLFYSGTMADYLGTAPLSERALSNIARNLALLQQFSEAMGAEFTFALAPNKNSLYPSYLPTRYVPSTAPANAERLQPYLEAAGVNYTNLFNTLFLYPLIHFAPQGNNEALYFQRDTHWNNRGADIAAQALAASLGLPYVPAGTSVGEQRTDHRGDLDLMLYPNAATPELDWYAAGINDGPDNSGTRWSYSSEDSDVEADNITTRGSGQGTLLMYRDSFGNALIPLLSAQTATAQYSRLVPYNGLLIADTRPDYVIVERAERNLSYLAENPPIAPSPQISLPTGPVLPAAVTAATTIAVGSNGPLVSVSGVVDPNLLDIDSTISVAVTDARGVERVFAAYGLSQLAAGEDNGYLAYLSAALLPAGSSLITVYVTQGLNTTMVGSLRY